MTDQKESVSHIPSNEEIINDLTKDLTAECTVGDGDKEKEGPNVIPAEFDKTDSEAEDDVKPLVPNDFVDEVALKEVESSLSQEDLDKRQEVAVKEKARGNEEFRAGNYLESVKIYTDALHLCPLASVNERSVLYCNRAAAKIQLNSTKSAIDDCSKAIELNDKYVRAYLRRAKLYEETDKLDESLEDFKKVLELDPHNHEGMSASVRLPPLINERNEKMKTEMIGTFFLPFERLNLHVLICR